MHFRALGGVVALVVVVGLCGSCKALGVMFGFRPKERNGLREPAKQEVVQQSGANTFRCTIQYKGGEGETWAIDRGAHCPTKYREHAFADNDITVPKPAHAAPGVDRVEVAVPTWCADYNGFGKGRDWNATGQEHRQVRDAQSTLGLLAMARFVAVSGCDRKNYAPRQRWVAHWLQEWLNVTGASLSEAHELMQHLVVHENATGLSRELACKQGPVVKVLACENRGGTKAGFDALDRAQLMGKVPVDRRIAYLQHCQGPVCGFDGARLDWQAARLQVKQSAYPILRFIALRQLAILSQRVSAEGKRVKADDFEAMKAALEAWKRHFGGPDKAQHRPAQRIITADKEDRAAACEAVPLDGLEQRIKAAAPKSKAEAEALVEDPVTELLLRAVTVCELEAKRPRALARAAVLRRKGRNVLGPRRAAARAIGAKVGPLPPGNVASARSVVREVTKVRKKGERLELTLKAEVWYEPLERCRETRRVDGIERDGTIIYREICRSAGKEKRTRQLAPILVPVSEAAGIRAGRVIEFVPHGRLPTREVHGRRLIQQGGPAVVADPIAVYVGGKGPRDTEGLLAYYGVAVRASGK